MENEIMVTVMVTFYNQKQYIYDSLSAIFSQKTDFRYEVLCGDDGSSDGTYEELLQWQEKYPDRCKVFQMPREQAGKYEPIVRVSNNRITLLKHAKGKYVTFLDGDDYYTDSCKLQKQVDLLEKHPDCVACGHPVTMLWDAEPDRRQVLGYVTDYPVKMSNKVYWSHLWLHADTFLFRNVYKGKEAQINADFFDDNLITCYFIKYGSVIYIPDDMVVYRQIAGSSWNMRSSLQKAIVNMGVYCESKKVIPEMQFSSFIRCYSSWKCFYINRNNDMEMQKIGDYIQNEVFVKDTLRYKEEGIGYKIRYELRYGLLMRSGFLIRGLKRLHKMMCRKL